MAQREPDRVGGWWGGGGGFLKQSLGGQRT